MIDIKSHSTYNAHKYDYSLSIKQALYVLNKIVKNIESNSLVPIKKTKITKINNDASISHKTPITITIGLKDFYKNEKNGYVKNKDFVLAILNCFHEQQHITQKYNYLNEQANDETKQMARIRLISTTIPEYYNKAFGYYHDINEIDAELYGIKTTKEFFQTNFPEIDVNKELIAIINESENWYAKKPVKSIDEAIKNLETAKKESYDKPIALPIKYVIPKNPSPMLKKFMQQETQIETYLSSKSGTFRNQLLLNFIAKYQPWQFLKYPCLKDEWPENLEQNKDKYRLQILLDKQHRTEPKDRTAELEEKFGHILAKIEEQQNKNPNYDF